MRALARDGLRGCSERGPGAGCRAGRGFLDRDGVLNAASCVAASRVPASVGDLVIRPGVRAACTSLRNFGVLLLVVTNQPDIARGTATRDEVDAINQHLTAELGLDAVLVCPHDDADGCDCRKPKPGLLRAQRSSSASTSGAASWWATATGTSKPAGGRGHRVGAQRLSRARRPARPHRRRSRRGRPLLIPSLTVEEDSLR